jgi:hypothetical protein
MSEGGLVSFRRGVLIACASLLVLLVACGLWFLGRPVTPGEFVIRVVPSGATPRGLLLSLRGPGGQPLGDWRFEDVPTPAVLAGLEKKVPWKAVATQASPRRPCVTVQVAPSVPQSALAPVERLVFGQCCPGLSDVARCPVRRVVLER